MATHFRILAWTIPWMEDPDRLQSLGLQRVGDNEQPTLSLFVFYIESLQTQLCKVLKKMRNSESLFPIVLGYISYHKHSHIINNAYPYMHQRLKET